MISEGLTNAIIKIFEVYGETLTEAARQTLSQNNIDASGRLSNSFEFKISDDNGIVTLSIYAEDYLKYVEGGRGPGTLPPIQNIIKWIQARGIESKGVVSKSGVRRGKAGIIRRNVKVSDQRFAFAIAKSIMLKGTKAKKVYAPIVQHIAPEISKGLTATVMNFVKEGIQDIWKEGEPTDFLTYSMHA